MTYNDADSLFNEVVGKLVISDTMCDLFLLNPDRVVAGAARTLLPEQVEAIRRIISRLRSGDPNVSAVIARVMRPADRSAQQ
jgi:hypothetical protein